MPHPSYLRHKVSKDAAEAFRRSRRESSNPTVVEAPSPVVTIAAIPKPKEKLRVAAYSRTSTSMDCQKQSAESQEEHFDTLIKANPDWIFAGSYQDFGLTGTKSESRPELQRLLQECKEGRINLILTKSISRFARNTADLLENVRTLKSYGVAVWFEEEKIRTDRMDSEFMLTLLARFAEDESHSISGNVKWTIRNQFRDGTYKQTIAPYGYGWEDRTMKIIPEEAAVVKRIFGMVLTGSGMNRIAQTLNTEGIPSPNGGKWSAGTLRTMVANEAYIGDVLYQKTFKDENFVQRENKGELDQYYISDHHEGIISREDFDNAQVAVKQRAKEVGYRDGANKNRGSQRYPFSGILVCKCCGTVLHRQTWSGTRPCWICNRHGNSPELCSMKPQSETDLKRAFINCLNKLAWSQKQRGAGILDLYEKALGKTEAEKNAERLAEIDQLLEQNRRETRLLNAVVMRERFLPKHREKKLFLTNQERELTAEKNAILIAGVPKGTLQGLKAFINSWKITDDESAFPEDVFTEHVERCVVNTGKMVEFHFKCGLKLTESLYRAELAASSDDRETKGRSMAQKIEKSGGADRNV